MRFERLGGRDVHDIVKANCRVFFVQLKTLYMRISLVYVCLGEEKGLEQWEPVWRKWRKEAGMKVREDAVNFFFI